jgi:hypothetical protein
MASCLLPAWFAALNGVGPPVVLADSLRTGGVPMPPVTGKAYPFAPAGYVLDTDNFTVQWDDEGIPVSTAEWVAENVEEAWSVFVVEHGWVAPPTTDSYRILVYLDRALEAAGLATYVSEEGFPGGVPVIYLNPDFGDHPDYFEGVVHHEFSHTIQFALRDWYGSGPEEWWYWEASSSWMQEYVRPDTHANAWLSSFYAVDTTVAFDTVNYGHEYAMYMLNMYLVEQSVGQDGFKSIWMDNDASPWLEEIERVTGETAHHTWAKFAGSYSSEQLSSASFFDYPIGEAEPRRIGGHLGAQYLNVGHHVGPLHLSDGVGTLVRDGVYTVFTDSVWVPDGVEEATLIVTNPYLESLDFTFSLDTVEDSGDSDTGMYDTGMGAPDDEGVDSGGSIESNDIDGPRFEDRSGAEPGKTSSGCSSVDGNRWLWWAGLVIVLRCRFESPSKCLQRLRRKAPR